MKIEKIPEGYLLVREGGNRCELWREYNGAESSACDAIDELIAERDALRAKIEAMEKQEPIAWMQGATERMLEHGGSGVVWSHGNMGKADKPLYALPGAKGE